MNAGVTKYESTNLPAITMYSIFCAACDVQIALSHLPNELQHDQRLLLDRNINDRVQAEFRKYKKLKVGTIGWNQIGEGELSLMFVLLEGLKNLIVTIYTGKDNALQWFENNFVDYIAGDSRKAREYLMAFTQKLGGEHRGLTAVAETIQDEMFILELTHKSVFISAV